MKKMENSRIRNWMILLAIVLLTGISLQACSPRDAGEATLTPTTAMTATLVQVSINGWFTTVWNGEPHYFITDDQGVTTRLLMDDKLAEPLGGPLELDRKRVSLTGLVTGESPVTVQVLSIQFEVQQ
jgi:hypothetical protein